VQGGAIKVQVGIMLSQEEPNYLHVQVSLLSPSLKEDVGARQFSLYSSEGELNIGSNHSPFPLVCLCQQVIEALDGSIHVQKSHDAVDSYEIQFMAKKSK
jgi:hypothetical protein